MKAHWRKCPRSISLAWSSGEDTGVRFCTWKGGGVKCPTCKGKRRIRVRPRKEPEVPKQSKFMRHMNIYAGKRRVSLNTLMRKIP